jgi:hypothetical protein
MAAGRRLRPSLPKAAIIGSDVPSSSGPAAEVGAPGPDEPGAPSVQDGPCCLGAYLCGYGAYLRMSEAGAV